MNELNRRKFLAASSAAAASLAWAMPAGAATSGPVRLIVGYPPGGAADTLARALVEPLRVALGVTTIVDNKPGAGGRIAADQFKTAPTDGSALLVSPASVITMAPHLYRSTRYDLERDFTAVAPLARLDLALYAGPGAPESVNSVEALVQWLQKNPKSNSCGIPGLGSTPHLAALLLGRQTRLDWELVPYQGDAPNFMALLGGEIAVAVSSLAGGMEHLKSGKLRLLAVTGSERSSFFPNVPTLSQAGFPGVVVEDRHSLFVPRQTPASTVAALSQAVNAALQSKEVTDTLQRLSLERITDTQPHFAALLKADSERWSATVKTLNLALE
ncbi:Bug family tripartite tricarboxylate transporter substrate binding protein [soil metagenome]